MLGSNARRVKHVTLVSRFAPRACPCCTSIRRRRIFDLTLDAFCSVNWSYVKDYANVLDLAGDVRFPIARCVECGFVYAELQPSAELLMCLYDRVVRHDCNREVAESRASVARRMRYVATLLQLAPPDRALTALDFGCGLGATLRLLVAAGVASIGYDPSLLRMSHVEAAGLRIATTRDELIADAPFDIVVCDNVLEHMPDPVATIAFLASVTVEGSLLYVSVPECSVDFIKAQSRAAGAGQPIDMSLNPFEHLNYFDLPHLDQLLARGGFRPVARTNLPGEVNVGLRPDPNFRNRLNNSLASAYRLVKYAVTAQTLRTVTHEFYWQSGSGYACAV
jgi:SAM-dependent methyltransferase